MATAQADGEDIPSPRWCANAEEFVRRRLGGADEPLSPAELAYEYDCTDNHMRQVVADLAADGEIHRVGRGMYVAGADDLPDDDTGRADECPHDDVGTSDEETGENTQEQTGSDVGDTGANESDGTGTHETDTGSNEPDPSSDDGVSAPGAVALGTAATGTAAAASAAEDGGDLFDKVDWRIVGYTVGVFVVVLVVYHVATASTDGQPPADQDDETAAAGGGLAANDAPTMGASR